MFEAIKITNKVIAELERELGINNVVLEKESLKIAADISKEFNLEDITNGKANKKIIEYVKPIILSRANIDISKFDNFQLASSTKANNNFDLNLFKMVNENAFNAQERAKNATNYIINKFRSLDLEKTELNEIMEYIKSQYTDEEILNELANELIENIKIAKYLERSSTNGENMLQQKVVNRAKKPISKKELLKKITTFAVIGILSTNVAIIFKKEMNKRNIISETNSLINSYVNTIDPYKQKENTRVVTTNDNPSIWERNILISNDGKSILQDNKGIANDINLFQKDPTVIDTVIMNYYVKMDYDLKTKLRNMDDILNNLGLNKTFLEYVREYVGFDEQIQNIIEKYKTSGYDNLKEEEKEYVKEYIHKYEMLRVDTYKEDLQSLKNLVMGLDGEIDGPSRN